MLVAERHGKILPEAQNHEDYLTSAVFGHLRYITPQNFWQPLLGSAKSSTPDESPLTAAIGYSIAGYTSLEATFWHYSVQYGEPDLILRFSGGDHPPLVVLVEVKLWSGKSGSGERDQLIRYLRLLNDLTPTNGRRFLVYVTPRDSLAEINDSLETVGDDAGFRGQVYRLQWQDVLRVARQQANRCQQPAATILNDVAEFLHRRGLEYFDGFRRDMPLDVQASDGGFYRTGRLTGAFNGFVCNESLEVIPIRHGGWRR